MSWSKLLRGMEERNESSTAFVGRQHRQMGAGERCVLAYVSQYIKQSTTWISSDVWDQGDPRPQFSSRSPLLQPLMSKSFLLPVWLGPSSSPRCP